MTDRGGAEAGASAPVLELNGILKTFPGVVANHDVDLEVKAAEIHAIVGENGAGKSTLMKIIYGMQRADAGTMRVRGADVSFKSPTDAINAGIGMVHQHFMLADNFTVLENIILGSEPVKAGVIDFDKARTRIREIGDAYGMPIDPDQLVETLGVSDRQRVEILKVLYRGARILILDEPTAVLVPDEVDELFQNLKELKHEGVTILFISHKLDEVLEIADAITVMRAGTTVASVLPAETDARRLAELMVGSELPTPETRESTVTQEVSLSVRGLTVLGPDRRPRLNDVSFDIHKGEILGVAGVTGNGQTELIDGLIGTVPVAGGTIVMEGDDITHWHTRRRREAGLGYIPEDRHRHGLLLTAPLWENVALGHQTERPFEKGLWFDRSGARKLTEKLIDDFDVRTPSPDVDALALSGGNQQKLIIGRELETGPKVLIAAHPTRGVDVGAQAVIWDALRDARAAGLAMLLISADLDELIGLSDTIVVLYGGRLVGRVDPNKVTPQLLGCYMTGTAVDDEASAS